MGIVLAGQGVRFSYMQDPSWSEAFDPCRVLEDVHQDGAAVALLPWQNGLRMAASDHVVLATAQGSGRYVGVISASDRGTDREPFLFLDAAYLAPLPGGPLTLQRMLAFLMLRIAGSEPLPGIIAACVQTPCYTNMLRAFGQRFRGAAVFPAQPGDIIIDLGMASLARRIVRVVRPGARCETANGTFHTASLACAVGGSATRETLLVLDASRANDSAILDDARRIYRSPAVRGTRGHMIPDMARGAKRKSAPVLSATAM